MKIKDYPWFVNEWIETHPPNFFVFLAITFVIAFVLGLFGFIK
jgi:hypothetical protein